MRIETERLLIVALQPHMAQAIHVNSLDEDNRRFVPDEVFETLEEAQETVDFLMEAYASDAGPFVYPILRKSDEANIGYVQACRVEEGFEIGYHVAKPYTGSGYATEAVGAFLPVIGRKLGTQEIWGVVLEENHASHRVLEKCGFVKTFEGMGPYHGGETRICRYIFRR